MNKSLLLLFTFVLVASGCAKPEAPETAPAETTASAAPAAGALLNANLVSAEELAAIPALGPEFTDAIIAQRPYLSLTQLKAALGPQAPDDVFNVLFVPLNLNAAPAEEIQLIPGVGDRMTREFLEYRPYVSMEQFRREMGKYVDEAEVARLAGYVYVPIDLNTASDEEILAIPGIGSRMLREFKEYRPYADMAQFRREMGKYVDANEVARMERYVEIRPSN